MNAVKRVVASSTEHPDRPDAPHLGVLLERARRALYARVKARFDEAGFEDFREAHGSVLAYLPDGGARLTDLAYRARVTKQSMGELVRELEKLGYVKRAADPTDGRAKVIVFTPRGRAADELGRATIRDTEREWAGIVGPEGVDALRETLVRVTRPVPPAMDGG